MNYAFAILWLLCPHLQMRSIAPYAPFQLPLDEVVQEIHEFVYFLRSQNMSVSVRGNWLFVDVNTCPSHVCLLHIFGCK